MARLVILHQPLTRFDNFVLHISDMELAANNAIRIRRMLYEHISSCTGQSIETIEKDCDRDFILDVKATMEYGW